MVDYKKVGFIGLGAMGSGMAASLLNAGFSVRGFDVQEKAVQAFCSKGGSAAASPKEAARGVGVLVLMVTTAAQAEEVLFGSSGATEYIYDQAVLVLCSTVAPDFVRSLSKRLIEDWGISLVDAPVSGGVARAAAGTLTIMASGSDIAMERVRPVLSAMSERLYVVGNEPGAGSGVKMVNQLLAGVHIAAAAEAMALGARAGLSTRLLYDIIRNAAGSSWMFENRVPHMLAGDFTPHSALDIFVKDLGIVLAEGQSLRFPLPVAAAAHQQFLLGSAAGLGREDDSAVVKIFERLAGVSVAEPKSPPPALPKGATLAGLPPEWPGDAGGVVRAAEAWAATATLVVLDDDPTGTQTVHDIAVLTEWSVPTLKAELQGRPACFFILTNSRALPTREASDLTREICTNVAEAARAAGGVPFTVVLRGDSTLRGHFPHEVEAAAEVVGATDAWLLCPFFLQGGRYTIDDAHYVAEDDKLVPAGQTEFAKDAAFGYKSSNLREWVEEMTAGRVRATDVASVSIDTIRKGGPDAVRQQLCALPKGTVCIVNAASDGDMRVFAAGVLQAEREGRRFLCRTAASFVSACLGLEARPPLGPADVGAARGGHGGLIVVGSYVPKTTKQVEALLESRGSSLTCITVEAEAVSTKGSAAQEGAVRRAGAEADASLAKGRDTLIMTSRQLVAGSDAGASLAIGRAVSSALVDIVRSLRTRPRYILAKGGITSSDIAVKALGATRALVAGQALAGVPLWRLGAGSRHPGVPYIVFPGNVGGVQALAEVVARWAAAPPASTLSILKGAAEGGYAVGAFNVYNLEGAQAVVAAADEERSPALLQIHPAALAAGGPPLVAACSAAAREAKVPVAVHFDHGSDEEQLLSILEMGFDSLMVDGSQRDLGGNVSFTKRVAAAAAARGLAVEAELGRLSGTEDGLTVEEYEGRLTDPSQAAEFLESTGVQLLAVCIGNVHGHYPPSGPKLDIPRLQALQAVAREKGALLVLHGASGLPPDLIQECVAAGVVKFNVNTEVRGAYMAALREGGKDVADVMAAARQRMQAVCSEKMRMFGSAGRA